jgi:hypothetical protein
MYLYDERKVSACARVCVSIYRVVYYNGKVSMCGIVVTSTGLTLHGIV